MEFLQNYEWVLLLGQSVAAIIGWIAAIYFYFKYRAFRKIEYEKEIKLRQIKLKPLQEKLSRSDSFWRAKLAAEGALDSGAGQELIRLKREETAREIAILEVEIAYYEDIGKRFIDLR